MNSTTGRLKERGIASLMVTTILMLVISLVVVGFSQVARRNQREALDRQLSSQAFYATESGVNAATAVIRNKVAANLPVPTKTSCAPDGNYPAVNLSGTDVRVTCLLVEPQVSTLVYDGVTESTGTVVPVTPVSGNVGSITITWRSTSGGLSSSCGSAYGTLPQRSGWGCTHGIMRVDLSAQPGGSASQFAKNFFLYPQYQGAAVTPTTTQLNANTFPGGMTVARCSDAGGESKCMATITGLNAPAYYLNLRSLYRPSKVIVDATAVGTGASLDFKSQVKIDVTAKAVDVFRRIQVRVPLSVQQSGSAPGYSIESSESVCKRFSVAPNYYSTNNQAGCPLP